MPDIKLPRRDEAMFDFVVSLKGAIGKHTFGQMPAEYQKRAAEYRAEHGKPPQTPEEIGELLDDHIGFKFNRCATRKSQEMMWGSIVEAYRPYEAEVKARLNRERENPKGSLTLNPEHEIPGYLAKNEFHIMPGGYYGAGDMSAIYYDMGGSLYFRKTTTEYRIQRALAAAVPPGNYQRILDLGCSDGGNSLALKLQFPEAEVYAIDASAPLLKFAYQNAEDRNLAIHFSQQNAEQTNFPDGSFDLISCYILFHELPREAVREVLREGLRLLRPGGLFISGDVTPFRENEPFRSFVSSWEVGNNGETYWREILEQTYMPAEFEEAGFTSVREFGVAASKISPKFPWATLGYKSE